MTAWHGNPDEKAQLLNGTSATDAYWTPPLTGDNAETHGIPEAVGHLLDMTCRLLPATESGEYILAAIEAIPAGADLSHVATRMVLEILIDPRHGVLRHTEPGSVQQRAVEWVAGLYQRLLDGGTPAGGEWYDAAKAAWVAFNCATTAPGTIAAMAAVNAAEAMALDEPANIVDVCDEPKGEKAVVYARWVAERLLDHLRTAPLG